MYIELVCTLCSQAWMESNYHTGYGLAVSDGLWSNDAEIKTLGISELLPQCIAPLISKLLFFPHQCYTVLRSIFLMLTSRLWGHTWQIYLGRYQAVVGKDWCGKAAEGNLFIMFEAVNDWEAGHGKYIRLQIWGLNETISFELLGNRTFLTTCIVAMLRTSYQQH